MDYFIRVSYPFTAIEPVFKQVEQDCSAYAVYEHNENVKNIHVHFYLKEFKKSTDTLKLWIEKTLGKRPNKTEWSFKNKEVNESCISYMSKGKLKALKVFGISPDRMEELTQLGYDVRDSTRVAPVKKKSQITQGDLIDEVFEAVNKDLPRKEQSHIEDWIDDLVDPECDDARLYYLVIKTAISIHRKHRKGFCDFSLKKIVQPVYCRFRVGEKSFVDKMMDNYFRSYKS